MRVIFRGLRGLNVIHEPLEHGSELTYEEHVPVPVPELAKWVSRKQSLAVFRERESSFAAGNPNLMPASVMKMMLDAGFDGDDIERRAKQPLRKGAEKRKPEGKKALTLPLVEPTTQAGVRDRLSAHRSAK